MKRTAQTLSLISALLVAPAPGLAQTVDLAVATGRRIVAAGTPAGAAGAWLDRGDVNGDVNNKDLFVGAPEAGGSRGEVRIVFGWVRHPGDFSLTQADVVLTGGAASDRFGTSTSAGFITTPQTNPETTARDLVVGAPGAQGGRGAVYLFAGPLTGGSFTPADAILRVIGAPGDLLGTAVQTVDLNDDGYREIVAGAPGNGRVYVIDYHNAPAAERDLSTAQPGVLTIGGGGIGAVLASGDISADSIHDLVIGAPAASSGAGAVYVLSGRTTALPSSISLPAGANAVFRGAEPGDHAGAALWIRDLDGDEQGDLVITAPDADGPANSRVSAGEAYIVFGRPSQPAILAPAVTFVGAAAGYQTGARVQSGDVTRDDPDDLAFLAPGANGGFGEVYVYYGRSRSAFPAVVDLATSANRRIVSDERVGSIQSLVVFEVTAEGAEDFAFGVPAADSGAGRVYFSISPTLVATPRSLSMTTPQGTSTATTIQIGNIGVPEIAWSARSNSSWLSVTPGGMASATGSAPATVTLDATRLAPGTYTGSLVIASEAFDLAFAMVLNVELIVTPGSGGGGPIAATNLFGLPSSRDEGAPGGVATNVGTNVMVVPVRDVLVRFSRVTAPGVTRVTLESSTSERPAGDGVRYGPWIYKISTTASYTGVVQVAIAYEAWGEPSQSALRLYSGSSDITASVDMSTRVIWSANARVPGTFFVVVPPPTQPSIRSTAALPTRTGVPITWKAAAAGRGGLLHYKFWRYSAVAGRWTVAQDYGPSDTYTWAPGRSDLGQFAIQVWIRRADSTASYDTWAGTALFSLMAPDPVVVDSLTANEPLPAPAGRRLTWTVRARGGVGPLQYRFWRLSGGVWSIVQDYGPSNVYTWQTTESDQGTHAIQAWVRSVDSIANYDAWKGTTVITIGAPQPLHAGPVAISGPLPMRAGTPLTFTARTSGGTGPLLYKFWLFSQATASWRVLQDYSPSESLTWTPDGGNVGTHAVQVWIRNAGSTASYDVWAGTSYFNIAAPPAITISAFGSSLPLPVPAGSIVSWTAVAAGGTGALEFKFWRFDQSTGSWTAVRDYAQGNTYSWTTGPSDAGTHAVQVWVRSAGSSATWEAWSSTGYFQITPQ